VKHAIFSPSAAERWLACPGSVRLSTGAPAAPTSPYALEGIAMHDLAARCLVENLDPKEHAPEVLPPGAIDAVIFYVELIRRSMARAGWFGIERTLRYNDYLFGTADYIGVTGDVLEVVDLKGGAGVLVAAENNPQLRTYAWLGLVDEKVHEHVRGCTRVRTTIVQPRAPNGPIREAEFGIEELVAWGLVLKRGMRAAAEPSPVFKTGAHCRWCPAAAICPALREQTKTALSRDPQGMSGTELAEWLDTAETLEAWIKALREYASQQITDGALVPGWIMRPKRAIRKWIDEKRAAEALRALGVEPYVSEIISVAQADKALKADFGALEDLWSAESSGYTLARGEEPALTEKGVVIEQAAQKQKHPTT
jgi:hypothetical protein